jgi:ketosteroid isomerase-like protein
MKYIHIVIVAAAFLMCCCGGSNSEENTEVAQKMFKAFNDHAWDKMSMFYSEEAQFLDPSFGKQYVKKNRSETSSKYAAMEKMFPDIHDEILGVYASGDKVIVEFISTGTMSDSVKFNLPIVSVLTIENGLIIKDATYYDLENP